MAYVVVRQFERHDGKALRKYSRGLVLSQKEIAKMAPAVPTLKAGGFIQEVPDDDSRFAD